MLHATQFGLPMLRCLHPHSPLFILETRLFNRLFEEGWTSSYKFHHYSTEKFTLEQKLEEGCLESEDWQSLVPKSVVEVINEIEGVSRLNIYLVKKLMNEFI